MCNLDEVEYSTALRNDFIWTQATPSGNVAGLAEHINAGLPNP